jgi:hypothetical protein
VNGTSSDVSTGSKAPTSILSPFTKNGDQAFPLPFVQIGIDPRSTYTLPTTHTAEGVISWADSDNVTSASLD